MIKRKNKITALLVAATSIMTLVPAMAADSSRLETKDGTIENAIAFQDGKYVYQGYKSDDDDDSMYYNDGTKDKELDDLDDADLNSSYMDKYAFANDGSDQYVVDLTNGEVDDDITPEDDADSAATKLQTKLKKTDRYGEDIEGLTADIFNGYTGDDNVTGALPGNKFGDVWYSYAVSDDDAPNMDADSNTVKMTTSGGATYNYLFGFTNQSGKYIDASYTANIYAYSTERGKTTKIDDYSNDFDDVDDDSKLLATLIDQPVVLTQDKDYIYSLVKVAITDASDHSRVTGGYSLVGDDDVSTKSYIDAGYITYDEAKYNTDTEYKNEIDNSKTTVRTYVQKVSKAQEDQKDDAYLPKTVETYEIGNKGTTSDNEFDCGDASDAYDAFVDAGVTPGSAKQDDVIDSDTGKAKFTAVNGNLVVIDAENDSIKGTTLNFKKDKVKFDSDNNLPGYKDDNAYVDGTTTSAAAYDRDDKVDIYFVEKDSDDDVDIDVDSGDEFKAYDFDVDGNPWVVTDGKIYEYVNGEMTKKFTCDSSLDSISVYDENNLITWENDGDIYTTVHEGGTEPAAPTTPAKVGWDQLADGSWNFYDATGNKVVNNWANVGGVWYYLDTNGTMVVGWQYINGAWYYFSPISDGTRGAMKTGWINDNGTWYYLKSSGAMATGWVNDNGTWYYLKSSGAMATGWINDNGTWYYLNASGAMLANTTVDGYRLGASGAWIG